MYYGSLARNSLLYGANGLLLAALVVLVRSLFRHWLDKDIATFRARLEAQGSLELERTRSELQKSITEHEVRFRNIHERIAETIAETYAHLFRLHTAVGSYIAMIEHTGEPSKKEKLTMVSDANEAFRAYFLPRQIYLPEETAETILTLYKELYTITTGGIYGQASVAMSVHRR